MSNSEVRIKRRRASSQLSDTSAHPPVMLPPHTQDISFARYRRTLYDISEHQVALATYAEAVRQLHCTLVDGACVACLLDSWACVIAHASQHVAARSLRAPPPPQQLPSPAAA